MKRNQLATSKTSTRFRKNQISDFFARVCKKGMTLFVLKKIYYQQLVDSVLNKNIPVKKLLVFIAFVLACASGSLFYAGEIPWALSGVLFAIAAISYPAADLSNRYLKQFVIAHKYSGPSSKELDVIKLRRLGIPYKVINEIKNHKHDHLVLEIASWGHNNQLKLHIEEVDGLLKQMESDQLFKVRERNTLDLVLVNGQILVRKTFSKRACFINELIALHQLKDLRFVTDIQRVDVFRKTLYLEFVEGRNLGNLFCHEGISVSQQYQDSLSNTVNEASRDILYRVMTKDQREELANKLALVHRKGVAIRDIKYGNVLLTRDGVKLIDFDSAYSSNRSDAKLFQERCRDIEQFNRLFGWNMLSVDDVDKFVAEASAESYAPIYIGKGVAYGKVGSIEFGTGKWALISSVMPLLKGKKVIDLGSNNGNLPLEMMRAGAEKVLGFELNPKVYELASKNKALYELVDNRRYNFSLVNDYMNAVLSKDISDYDIATSFCSLYYESVENMEKITAHFANNVSIFVVQANENTEEHSGEMLERSSVPFLQKILAENGFSKQRVYRFPFYDRPLIIAYADRMCHSSLVAA